jgi:hypothetical protein
MGVAKWLGVLASIVLVGSGSYLIHERGTLNSRVDNMTEEEMTQLAAVLEFSGTNYDFKDMVKKLLVSCATGLIVLGGLEVFVVIVTWMAQAIIKARAKAMEQYEETKRQYEMNGLPPPVPPGFDMMELYFIAFPNQGADSSLDLKEGEEVDQDRMAAILAAGKAGGVSYKAQYRRRSLTPGHGSGIIHANRGRAISIATRGEVRMRAMEEGVQMKAKSEPADPEKIAEMVRMGFEPEACAEALSLMGNHIGKATALIIGQQQAERKAENVNGRKARPPASQSEQDLAAALAASMEDQQGVNDEHNGGPPAPPAEAAPVAPLSPDGGEEKLSRKGGRRKSGGRGRDL